MAYKYQIGDFMCKKIAVFLSIFLLSISNIYAINVTLEINDVRIDGGLLYVAIYSNEDDFRNGNSTMHFILAPISNTVIHNIELPAGEYVVSIFQDTNSNGRLDTGIFGIPREPVGITNYSGNGRPGGFQELKVPVNNNARRIIVNMANVRLR